MITFRLIRLTRQKEGAFGVLVDMRDGLPFAVTVERTYATNYRDRVTKIPPGIYTLKKGYYNKGGYPTWEIEVPGHTHIKFHKGNWESDLDGCPAVGESYDILLNKPAVLESWKGFGEFMDKAAAWNGGLPMELEVVEYIGGTYA